MVLAEMFHDIHPNFRNINGPFEKILFGQLMFLLEKNSPASKDDS